MHMGQCTIYMHCTFRAVNKLIVPIKSGQRTANILDVHSVDWIEEGRLRLPQAASLESGLVKLARITLPPFPSLQHHPSNLTLSPSFPTIEASPFPIDLW